MTARRPWRQRHHRHTAVARNRERPIASQHVNRSVGRRRQLFNPDGHGHRGLFVGGQNDGVHDGALAGIADGAFLVGTNRPRAVDGFGVYPHPIADFAQTILHFRREGSIGARAHIEEQVAVFRDHVNEQMNKRTRRLLGLTPT